MFLYDGTKDLYAKSKVIYSDKQVMVEVVIVNYLKCFARKLRGEGGRTILTVVEVTILFKLETG